MWTFIRKIIRAEVYEYRVDAITGVQLAYLWSLEPIPRECSTRVMRIHGRVWILGCEMD